MENQKIKFEVKS